MAGEAGDQDRAEAETLYKLLEEKIIPLYYDRNYYGIPHNWVKLMKQTIRSNIGLFSTRRMIKEYIEQMYLPAILHASEQNSPEVHGSAGNYLRWLPNRDNPELSRKQ
jgi:glucan phosphorylase